MHNLKNKNTRNKQARALSYINNNTNDLKKVMKEIEVYDDKNQKDDNYVQRYRWQSISFFI